MQASGHNCHLGGNLSSQGRAWWHLSSHSQQGRCLPEDFVLQAGAALQFISMIYLPPFRMFLPLKAREEHGRRGSN